MTRIVPTLPLLFLAACSFQQKKAPLDTPPVNPSAYDSLIKDFTHSDKQYSGLHNTFQIFATIIDSKVAQANLNQLQHYMQWDDKKFREEREKKLQEMSSTSTFLVALYTPEKDHNDLNKGNKSIWKMYLDHNGSRYMGKAKKSSQKFIQLKTLFPHITKFHKLYIVTFDIPMSAIEGDTNQLTFTSSLGFVTFKYRGFN